MTRAVVAATAVEAIFSESARNVVFELTTSKARLGESTGDESRAGTHTVWNEKFQALSTGVGGFRSYYDQLRDAVMADLRTWALEAEEARARITAGG